MGIFVAFWSIQIVNHEEYRQLAIRNITRKVDLPAPRGMIVDRSGTVLAENKINFTLYLVRENVENLEKTIQRASFFSGKSSADIQQIIAKYKKYASFYRIPIKSNLPRGTVIFIQSRQDEFPEFEIDMEPSRTFPLADRAAHVLGYLSEISEDGAGRRSARRLRPRRCHRPQRHRKAVRGVPERGERAARPSSRTTWKRSSRSAPTGSR